MALSLIAQRTALALLLQGVLSSLAFASTLEGMRLPQSTIRLPIALAAPTAAYSVHSIAASYGDATNGFGFTSLGYRPKLAKSLENRYEESKYSSSIPTYSDQELEEALRLQKQYDDYNKKHNLKPFSGLPAACKDQYCTEKVQATY